MKGQPQSHKRARSHPKRTDKLRPDIELVRHVIHRCTEENQTFEGLSRQYYYSQRYADALRQYNLDYLAQNKKLLLLSKTLQVGDRVLIPNANVLETSYPNKFPTTKPLPAAPVAVTQPLSPPTVKRKVDSVPTPVGLCPWRFRVQLVRGRTHLTASTATGLEFLIRCDKLHLQRPNGHIEAQGSVEIVGKDFTATSEHLTIAWQEELVRLQGKARLRSRHSGEVLELRSEQLTFQLTKK